MGRQRERPNLLVPINGDNSRPSGRRWGAWLALFWFVLLVHVTSPNAMVADSLQTIPVAQSMVHRRTLSLDLARESQPGDYGIDEVDGHLYPTFPWTVSLFAVPVVMAVDGAQAIGIGPGVDGRVEVKGSDWEFQVLTSSVVVALTTVLVYQVAIEALVVDDERRRRRLATLAALVFSFCTPAWSTGSRSLWQHGPSMLLLTLVVLVAVRSRSDPRSVRWLGAPLAASYAVRPTNVIPLVLFSLWMVVRHRRFLVLYATGMVAVLVPFIAVNLGAWGSLLPPYYSAGRIGGNRSFGEALLGNLFSPARGLVVFSPVLALAIVGIVLKRKGRAFDGLDTVLVMCVALHWVVISSFPHWWGGHSYGPRLFSDMVPFLVVLALPVLSWLAAPAPGQRRGAAVAGAAIVVTAASFLIHLQGAYLRSSWCWNSEPAGVDQDRARLWDWQDPQFLRGARVFLGGPVRRSEIVRGGSLSLGCPKARTS